MDADHQLAQLPAELHALVAKRQTNPRDVLQTRLASALLRGPAARAIKKLRAPQGELPAEAWEVFPEATGLAIELDEGSASFPELHHAPTSPASQRPCSSCISASAR
jgi:hypothetical protein